MVGGQRRQHPDFLGALAREQQGVFHSSTRVVCLFFELFLAFSSAVTGIRTHRVAQVI